MDEKSKQLLQDSRQPIEAKPGKLEKYDYEYKRKGTCNIFLAVAPKAGIRIVKVTDTRTKKDFAYFIEDLADRHFRTCNYIQLVLDNLNNRNSYKQKRWLHSENLQLVLPTRYRTR